MVKHVVLFVALMPLAAGCTPIAKPAPGMYAPSIAHAIALADDVTPNPTPVPVPAGECTNCGGDGELGDGTITLPCPVCGGDGRVDEAPKRAPAASAAAKLRAPEIALCPDGTCSVLRKTPPPTAEADRGDPPRRRWFRGRAFRRGRG